MTHLQIKLQRVFLLAFSVSHLPQASPGEQLHKYKPWAIFSKSYRHIPISVNIRYGGPSHGGLPGMFSIRHAIRRSALSLVCHFCRVCHTKGEDKLKRSGAWILWQSCEWVTSKWLTHSAAIFAASLLCALWAVLCKQRET